LIVFIVCKLQEDILKIIYNSREKVGDKFVDSLQLFLALSHGRV